MRVADFGVASAVGLDSLTMTGTVLGTAGYLAPEQARGERATAASDLYGLAVVAWELLTGQRPFESESPTAEAAAHVNVPVPSISQEGSLPPELDPVFHRALAKDPADRYPTAVEFVSALTAALHDAEETTQRVAAVTEERYPVAPAGPPRRSSAILWGALGLLALLLLGGGLALAGVFGSDDPGMRTVVQRDTITRPGTTVTTQVTTTAPATTQATTPPPPPPPPPPSPPSNASGTQLTDQATALLRAGQWAQAEAVARQAVAKLDGSGELYEAYAKYNLGRALAEQGKCEEALPLLNQSEQIQGSRQEIREARALCG
jgi:eukaryotic-like serine/threonine-protein kinase